MARTDFAPLPPIPLRVGNHTSTTTQSGLPSSMSMPVYSLQVGGQGIVWMLGWSGNWQQVKRLESDWIGPLPRPPTALLPQLGSRQECGAAGHLARRVERPYPHRLGHIQLYRRSILRIHPPWRSLSSRTAGGPALDPRPVRPARSSGLQCSAPVPAAVRRTIIAGIWVAFFQECASNDRANRHKVPLGRDERPAGAIFSSNNFDRWSSFDGLSPEGLNRVR
eukprot:COSAG04_NODE_18_length_39571_cov_50.788128_13_plen_222_part_00